MSEARLVAALVVLAPLAVLGQSPGARATLVDAKGKEIGAATFAPADGGVKVTVKASGLAPGKHGLHLHAAAKCEGPDFKSAGPHFNPAGKKHGQASPDGAHAGDLPNLEAGPGGEATASFVAKGVTLGEGEGSLFGKEGTSLVVHADPDDEKTDPSGNSGARIACGVVERG